MAKSEYKNIRMKIPSEVHRRLKVKAMNDGKNFLEWLNDLLKSVAAGQIK